ncbi:ribokinase [Roseateles oligotrophus]|uniref:Ribokinase n=1 Tax=Roseateles oligotrophus TaxID=1769250 RepID=A0ABT2YMB7_9BURK|nr:ribokinase [Roseateles oligotrophus]MCV2371214.1 ribokinase [Roseateles oligotrophus]
MMTKNVDGQAIRARVAVVGSINMDMVAHSTRLPAPGETLAGEAFVMAPGGKGANQAVAAARLGAAVDFVARVGMRQYGPELLQALQIEGIACEAVMRDAKALPGIAVIMVASKGGENAIVYIPGSNADLSAADVAAAAPTLRGAGVVVAQLEVPMGAIQAAFELARGAGSITVLNAAPAQELPEALLGLTDWLVLNETEASQLSGVPMGIADDTREQARRAAQILLKRGVKQVLVTLGSDGALLCTADLDQHFPARAVIAVDTVGAGDTLVGGLVAGLAEGLTSADAVCLGQAAAAIAVSRSGVQSAMPQRAELGAEFALRRVESI